LKKLKILNEPETIILNKKGAVATISLHRPEVRNALNLQMIREISRALEELNSDGLIRVIVFSSQEDYFCSGADLKWMKEGGKLSERQLQEESLELARLYRLIRESSAVTISSVKGFIPGGAIGLLAASDFVVAETTVVLAFSELKLGLIPATIAPHVLRKAGFGRTSDWMMTGRPVEAREAFEAGLIQRICEKGALERATRNLIEELLAGGPEALKGVKRLLRQIEGQTDPEKLEDLSSRLIASFRASPEGQEGMKAFLEKRKPYWNEGN
jgi:methylglutaconyl-CoA hydratase